MTPLKTLLSERIDSIAQRLPRMFSWQLITLALLVAVWVLAPRQLPVTLYKLSLVSLAGVVGYWFDRKMFPYSRPDQVPDDRKSLAELRRAIIVVGAMVAMGLGA